MGKIYTKKGDFGQTSLLSGEKVWKDDKRVASYASLDELNSFLGVVKSFSTNNKLNKIISLIQKDLMVICSVLADSKSKADEKYLQKRLRLMEQTIDNLQEKLPPLTNFIIPGGSQPAALLQFARTVCRRAEREIVSFAKTSPVGLVLTYINRLSDLLFILSLWQNKEQGQKEELWKKGKD